jgi:hypothetical protein
MPTPEAVLGTVSLITWSLIVIISLKYAVLMLRADNRGEGGIVALLAVLRVRRARPRTWRSAVLILGLVGAALLYGDGAITPAISVLSALEGLKVDAPQLGPMVLPLAVVILLGLFFVQRRGTGFIGGIFGPIMLAWFITIGILGPRGIIFAPSILAALNPTYTLTLLLHAPPLIAFAVLRRHLPGGLGRRGYVCRLRALRVCPDPRRVVRHSAAGASTQLLRPGRAVTNRPALARRNSGCRDRNRNRNLSAGRERRLSFERASARRACLTGWWVHYASMAVSGFQGSRESANFQASSGVVGMSLRHNDHGAAERRSKIVPERKPHADPP